MASLLYPFVKNLLSALHESIFRMSPRQFTDWKRVFMDLLERKVWAEATYSKNAYVDFKIQEWQEIQITKLII